MRVAKCSIIDDKTRKSLVAKECSYNMACSYLDKQGFTPLLISMEEDGTFKMIMKVGDLRRTFWYDEARGYLLGE